MARVTVIGAGAAGLATAALLANDGHDVHVLERGSRAGGRAGRIDSRIEQGAFVFDTGPSWYLMPQVYEHFFRMLGTSAAEQLDLRLLDPGYRVLVGSDAAAPAQDQLDVPHGEQAVRAVFEAREPGAGRALANYLTSARAALEVSLRSFLYNPFTSVRPFVADGVGRAAPDLVSWLLPSLSDFVTRRFTDPVLRQVLTYPAVFLGTDPRSAPAIYHLMSQVDLDDGVFYPVGGFTGVMDVLERLAVRAGARITLEAEVTRIAVERHPTLPGRGTARGVTWRDAEGGRHREESDLVISAADLHHTETRLVPEGFRSYPERSWRRSTPGPSAVLVMLGVRGELPELPHHTLLFSRDWDASFDAVFHAGNLPSPTSLYVCKPSATDPGVAPPGHENLFVLIPCSGEVGLGHGTGYPDGFAPSDAQGDHGSEATRPREPDRAVERIADAAVAQLATSAGIPDLAERVVVRHTLGPADFGTDYHSWRDGMLGPAHTLAQSAMFRRGPRSRRVRGLYYVGATAAPGVGVPMCLISAELALKLVRGDGSGGPLPEPAAAHAHAATAAVPDPAAC